MSLTNAIHSAYNEVPSLAYVDEVFEGQAWSLHCKFGSERRLLLLIL